MKKISRRSFLQTVGVATLATTAMSLVGCSDTASSTTTTTTTTTSTASDAASSTATDEPVTLTILHHFEEAPMQAWLDTMTAAYMAQNSNVTVDLQYTGYDNYFSLLKTKIASDDAPDVFVLQGLGTNYEFIENDYLLELNDSAVAERLLDTAVGGGSMDGNLYAIPYEQTGFGVFYNVDLFTQAGVDAVPTTHDEFIEACEKLQAAGITPIGQSYADVWTLICDMFVDNLNSQLVDDEYWHDKIPTRELRFADNPGDVKGMFERLKQRMAYGQGNQFATDWNTVIAEFAAGNIAMLNNGTWTPGNIRSASNEAADMNIGTFAFPYSSDDANHLYPLGTTGGFVAYKGTKNQAALIAFMEFITEAEQAKGMAEARGSLSVVKDVDADIEPTLNDILVYIDDGKVRDISNVNRAFPGEFDTAYMEVTSEYLLTDISVDDAMIKLDEEFDRIAELG